MYPILDYPHKMPLWGATPSQQIEPPDSEKIMGAIPGQGSPAFWENWRTMIQHDWLEKIPLSQLMNWRQGEDIYTTIGQDIQSAIFHPEIGLWLVGTSVAPYPPKYSADGCNWVSGQSLSGASRYGAIAIDSNYYIMANGSDDLKYSVDAGQTAWSTIADATIGGTGEIRAIHTKYPDSDFLMLARGDIGDTPATQIRIAVSGIVGAWTSPTTPPPSVPANSIAHELLYCGDSTWVLLTGQPSNGPSARFYRSTDDGDTWVVGAIPTFPAASVGPMHMAINRDPSLDSNRIVMVGSDDPSTQEVLIEYSDDYGVYWNTSTIDNKGLSTTGLIKRVYHCGGQCWVASYSAFGGTATENKTILVSVNNGRDWRMADVNGAVPSSGTAADSIACDGRQVMVFGSEGFNIKSLAS